MDPRPVSVFDIHGHVFRLVRHEPTAGTLEVRRCSCGALRLKSVKGVVLHLSEDGTPDSILERCRDADAREVHES